MYKQETHKEIPASLRAEIDELIHLCWSFESIETNDVELLVSRGSGVHDPLDSISNHVIVRNESGLLIGYGRIAIVENIESVNTTFEGLQTHDVTVPVAYISRLVVHPDFRGRGIANIIHRSRLQSAVNEGAKVVYGWAVGDKPRSALSQLGFKEISKRDGFLTAWYRTNRTTRLVKFEINHVESSMNSEFTVAAN